MTKAIIYNNRKLFVEKILTLKKILQRFESCLVQKSIFKDLLTSFQLLIFSVQTVTHERSNCKIYCIIWNWKNSSYKRFQFFFSMRFVAVDKLTKKSLLKSIPNSLESNVRLLHNISKIWLQKCKHLGSKNQSKLSCSIPIGSETPNLYIFEEKFLQTFCNRLIFDSWLFGMV